MDINKILAVGCRILALLVVFLLNSEVLDPLCLASLWGQSLLDFGVLDPLCLASLWGFDLRVIFVGLWGVGSSLFSFDLRRKMYFYFGMLSLKLYICFDFILRFPWRYG
ncbi:hypothetical protein BDC45DRAFT_542076 [Circinella umbellata]|nr:hypothetical protein BDC45DRAFT_542076 [Circinella umbellata]